MKHDHPDYHQPEDRQPWWNTSSAWVAIFFFLAAGYFLMKEHSAHIVPYLPWLILLLCPLMHLFHHGGHGNHSHNHGNSTHDEKED